MGETLPLSSIQSTQGINPQLEQLETQGEPKKINESGFRIKKAAHIAFVILSITFAALAVAATTLALVGAFVTPVIPISLMTTAAIITAVALAALLTAKLWQVIEPHMPGFIRIPGNYIQSALCGLISGIALGCLFPVNLEKKNPTKEECDSNETPILMIHGFMGSSNNWIYHRSRLKNEGYKNIYTINLGNIFTSIDDYAKKVQKLVQQIQERTGSNDIRIISHSMGGLVARHYRQFYAEKDEENVKDIITMGTPLDGTRMAWLTMGLSKAGRQMFPRSEFVKQQQAFAATDQETHYLHIASKCDYVIWPTKSAKRGGKAPKVEKAWLHCTGHIPYLFSDAAADTYLKYMRRREFEELKQTAAAVA